MKQSLGWLKPPIDQYVLWSAHILPMFLHTLLFSYVHVNMKRQFYICQL